MVIVSALRLKGNEAGTSVGMLAIRIGVWPQTSCDSGIAPVSVAVDPPGGHNMLCPYMSLAGSAFELCR